MPWAVDWDGAFVVGGDRNLRLTPNFKLREFQNPSGSVRVHRELVVALQVLRDRFGKGISITSVDADGLGAVVQQADAGLLKAAQDVQSSGLLESVDPQPTSIHVRISEPSRMPSVNLAQALETAFLVTSGFETSGDKFQQITGNFDDAGLSFGPAQVNFATGTLGPLFQLFKEADEPALRACFGGGDDYSEWLEVLAQPVAKQIEWANNISTGRSRADVVEPWKGYFHAVGRVERFRQIMVESILHDYGKKLVRSVAYLKRVKPDIRIDHLRCFCSLWDLVIQQGSVDLKNPKKGIDTPRAIEDRIRLENPKDQFHLVRIAVEERAKTASPQWRDDCASRRLGLLNGIPTTVGAVQRANIQFYLLRDARVDFSGDVENPDVDDEIVAASAAVAAGTGVYTV